MITALANNSKPKMQGYDRYIRSVNANLLYWQQQLEGATDAELLQLRDKFALICRAVLQAVVKPETQERAGEVAWEAFNFAERSGQWSEWCYVLQKVISASRQEVRIKLLIQQGQFLLFAQEIEKAIQSQQKILDMDPDVDELVRAKVHINLSSCYLTQRDFLAAEAYLNKGLVNPDIFQKDVQWSAVANNCLGRLHTEGKGDFPKAKAYYEKSLKEYESCNDTLNCARVLHNLGHAHMLRGKNQEALTYLYKSQQAAAAVSARLETILVEFSIGSALFNLNKWKEAQATFLAIDSDFLETYGFDNLLASVLNNLAYTYMAQKKHTDAREMLNRCLQIWKNLNNKAEYANSWGAIGESYHLEGDNVLAKKYLTEAIELLEALPQTTIIKTWLKQYKKYVVLQSKC